MAAQPVEWVLVIYYGPSAHRATYGRLDNTKYTKDYIQLSRTPEFLGALSALFPIAPGGDGSVPLTYQWPTGTAHGALVFKSSDRPHLKWDTNRAPRAWKMSLSPSEATAETVRRGRGRVRAPQGSRRGTAISRRHKASRRAEETARPGLSQEPEREIRVGRPRSDPAGDSSPRRKDISQISTRMVHLSERWNGTGRQDRCHALAACCSSEFANGDRRTRCRHGPCAR
jgi:hypothetical protein